MAVGTHEGDGPLPPIARVRQRFAGQPTEADAAGALERAVAASHITGRIPVGGRVALAADDALLAARPGLARAATEALRRVGLRPFLLAVGGANPPDPARFAAAVGCGGADSADTVTLGTNRHGLPIVLARAAFDADGIVLLAQVGPHPSFAGDYECGLLELLVVGMGLRPGAAQARRLGPARLGRLLPEVGAYLLRRAPVALGLAVLENARGAVARVEAVEPEELLELEPRLLDEARRLARRLPFDELDVLVVAALVAGRGGPGLAPHVVGRRRVETMPEPERPRITRVAVLAPAPGADGDGVGRGLGQADLVTERLARAVDPAARRAALADGVLARARVPLALPTDRDVVAASLDTCWRIRRDEARLVLVASTSDLETLWITPALAGATAHLDDLAFESDFAPMPFDDAGALDVARLFAPDPTS